MRENLQSHVQRFKWECGTRERGGSETENESRRVSPWLAEENRTHWVTVSTESSQVKVVSE